MNESILVFTHRSVEFLTKLNGSTSWQLNPERAKQCEYVICARNSNSPLAEDDFPHSTAFLIGKISNVVQSLNLPRDEHRYMIEFLEYAEISIPNVWKGWRSPVIYKNTNELESELNIDFKSLEWVSVPSRDHDFIEQYFEHENSFYESRDRVSMKFKEKKKLKSKKGLSISEAKDELSKYYEIDKENIEIVLRG
tara:strand:- start:706 stop:1290 length:585 start_codon:yes stop_codon:yes gene_type:complete